MYIIYCRVCTQWLVYWMNATSWCNRILLLLESSLLNGKKEWKRRSKQAKLLVFSKETFFCWLRKQKPASKCNAFSSIWCSTKLVDKNGFSCCCKMFPANEFNILSTIYLQFEVYSRFFILSNNYKNLFSGLKMPRTIYKVDKKHENSFMIELKMWMQHWNCTGYWLLGHLQ